RPPAGRAPGPGPRAVLAPRAPRGARRPPRAPPRAAAAAHAGRGITGPGAGAEALGPHRVDRRVGGHGPGLHRPEGGPPMLSATKVTGEHLRRDAYLYVRPSSLQHVQDHRESTARQYDLPRRAHAP